MSKEILADDFLFGGVDAQDATLSVFDKQSTTTDGIYRPNLKDAKDKKIGFEPNQVRLSANEEFQHAHRSGFKIHGSDGQLRKLVWD